MKPDREQTLPAVAVADIAAVAAAAVLIAEITTTSRNVI